MKFVHCRTVCRTKYEYSTNIMCILYLNHNFVGFVQELYKNTLVLRVFYSSYSANGNVLFTVQLSGSSSYIPPNKLLMYLGAINNCLPLASSYNLQVHSHSLCSYYSLVLLQ
jgi:hypothetical protein